MPSTTSSMAASRPGPARGHTKTSFSTDVMMTRLPTRRLLALALASAIAAPAWAQSTGTVPPFGSQQQPSAPAFG